MGAEDFSYMLNERPGCYVWLGQGGQVGGEGALHHPRYNFNDEALPIGASYFRQPGGAAPGPGGVTGRSERRGHHIRSGVSGRRAKKPAILPRMVSVGVKEGLGDAEAETPLLMRIDF